MEEHGPERPVSAPPHPPPLSDVVSDAGPSTSSPLSSSYTHQDSEAAEVHDQQENQGQPDSHRISRRHHHYNRHWQPVNVYYRFNIVISNLAPSYMRDDVWSCLVVLVTFWFFASVTLILGFYGSVSLQLGPNCSRLITANPIFVQSIKSQEIEHKISGPMLYGFHKSPSLDVTATWSETHSASVKSDFHKEWIFHLNKGSKLDVSYDVQLPSYAPLSLVVAQGRDSLVEWLEDPSYPNSTLSWNIIYGSGRIEQDITESATYFVAVGNLNPEAVNVQLNFTIKALLYNTTQAYFKCSLSDSICNFKLFLMKANAAILTSPGPGQAKDGDKYYVKVSYGPRWLTYFIGSGLMTIFIFSVFQACSILLSSNGDESRIETGETGRGQEAREPLISPKDDDLSSWGSSCDSGSHDEEDLEERQVQEEGKPPKGGGQTANANPCRLCVLCFDSPRDCFFLPCGHCAACFTCGSKIGEEAGSCPICRRKIKKVRKIYSV
ncbi:hypothetical protein Nepgr_013002 [Nepenthes gracilis]|uniref:RING-type domain-containing protein n=1 Tax=Nepenthes gracilis TaxID=150966 RepID=A0AAD3XNW3_NEPGR|nr:hypothetical protein Nepgr_013002 [Nepenthes gracilis]